MYITVSDAMNMDLLKNFKLIAGHSGLKNKITKVGILDFEFTKQGVCQWAEEQFIENEFLLTTFLYARDNEALIFDALKRLIKIKSSGLAIKNVFSFKISKEIIRYANLNSYPIFIFTDHSVFFENLIIDITNALNLVSDYELIERKINTILHQNFNKNMIKQLSLEINHSFKNCFIAIYFKSKDTINKLNTFGLLYNNKLNKSLDPYSSILKYKNGFFYVATFDSINSSNINDIFRNLISKLNIDLDNYSIGVSNPQYYLTEFKKGLQESLYASQINEISENNIDYYNDIGVYKFILPFIDEEWVMDFYLNIVNPLIEYDINNNSEMLNTAIKYVECNGSIKDTSAKLFHHENTIRYRISKISEIINIEIQNKSFYEQLSIALKIHKIISDK